MTVRCFVALPLPESLANLLGDEAARLAYQDKANAVRWVNEENYHVTLAFLDELTQAEIDRLADNLAEHLFLDAINLKIRGLSPFPESRPKLIAAILEKSEDLVSIHEQVSKSIRSSELITEKRKFMPHITLGRYRNFRRKSNLLQPIMFETEAEANNLTLFESVLTPTGAEYTPLYEFDLA